MNAERWIYSLNAGAWFGAWMETGIGVCGGLFVLFVLAFIGSVFGRDKS